MDRSTWHLLTERDTEARTAVCQVCGPIRMAKKKGSWMCGTKKHRDKVTNNYGINWTVYNALLEAQGGVCKVCKEPEPSGKALAIDHDHACCPGDKACGKCVRGLLCMRCNTVLGKVNDDPTLLMGMASYLQEYAGGSIPGGSHG